VPGSIEYLLRILDYQNDKALEILHTFINETPPAIEQLRSAVEQQQWHAGAQIIHRIKTRFGYLGQTLLMADLSTWENDLNQAATIDAAEELANVTAFHSIVGAYIQALQEAPLFQQIQLPASVPPMAGRIVLIAEDDAVNAMVLEMFVSELAGTVIKVTDGYQAVRSATTQPPDLIFMDVHMPVFGGLDAIRALRRQGVRCPIVSLSASTRLAEREQSLQAGADDFLIKPASRAAVQAVLRKFFTPVGVAPNRA
jgi:CheY-like chemotaxis protein